MSLNAVIDGAQANAGAGTGSPGTGFARVAYDEDSMRVSWRIEWAGLSGEVTNMHFHGPAAPGANAGVALGIDDQTSPSFGTAVLDAGQAADLLAGLWYVNIHTTVEGGGEVRGQVVRPEMVVGLDASGLAGGELASWPNTGTAGGEFVPELSGPMVESVGGVNAAVLNGADTWMVGPDTPGSVTGTTSKSIVAWVNNEFAADEETVIAWGRRGGGDGTNLSFNHGLNTGFGAVGHWGGDGDVGWMFPAPVEGAWTQVVYNYDAGRNRTEVYSDGLLSNAENHGVAMNTHATDSGGSPLPFVLGNQNEADGTRVAALSGSMAIGEVEVYAGVLSAEEVLDRFVEDAPGYGAAVPALPVLSSFSGALNDATTATLRWSVVGAESVVIDNGVGDVTGLSEVVIAAPGAPTTYTLSATAGGNTETAEVTLGEFAPAELIHQWTFNAESGGAGTELIDSVGGANGTIVDGGTLEGAVSDGKVTLAGGSSANADYVEFPGGLLEGLESVSIETWMTLHSAQTWGRVFSFGPGDGTQADTWFLSSTIGGNANAQRLARNGFPDVDTAAPTEFGREYHIVMVWDANGGDLGDGEHRWYRDGALVGAGTTNGQPLEFVDDSVLWLGRSQWGADATANATWSEVNIYGSAMSDGQIMDNFAAGPIPPGDRDGDGMPDLFEGMHAFLDPDNPADAALDQDSDNLTNKQEYDLGTDLEVADTDMDGIDDGAEVGAANPTDPLDPDSDDDRLTDGAEVDTHGTDPNDPNTDGDIAEDWIEVERGSNPLDAASEPDPVYPGLSHRWSFGETGAGGTVLADSVGGQDGVIVDQFLDDGSVGGGQVTLAGGTNADASFVEFPFGLLVGRDSVTLETWATQHAAQNWSRVFSFGPGSEPPTNAWFLSWSIGTNTNAQRMGKEGLPDVDTAAATEFDREYHIVAVWDPLGGPGGNGEYRWYRDGELVGAGTTNGQPLEIVNDNVLWLGRSHWAGDNTASASWNEFRIWDGAFTLVEVADSFARGVDLDGGGGREGFQVTAIVVGNDVALTWNSAEGMVYDVEKKDGLDAPAWEQLVDNLPSGGAETTFTDTTAPAGVPVRFYRVLERPAAAP